MKGDPKIPSLAAVNAAWVTVHAAAPHAVTVQPEARAYPHARPFYQGLVLEHLRQERERAAGSKLYRPLTALHRRAIKLTRLWLEFGDWP